ncbi:HTATIP2 [Bugula neritina]|uniref:Protein HTATIP2 n=1 Tax=Bugula neritina TaxID=10212 RepID=A0A7J7J147_BUGNE|nr:HTATIP2 [Bugula neritina]
MATGLLRSAFVVGYTGATGKDLVKELAKSKKFEQVVLIGRRKVEYEDQELQKFEQRIVDFQKLSDFKDSFKDFDVGFCCLGTTKKDAGSAEAFRRIDFDYVHELATYAKEGGVKHFHYVSSAGADKNSSFLYARVKGEIEEALAKLSFDRLSIYQPKFLKRKEQARGGEKFIGILLKPLELVSPQTVVTPCDLLARAMINNCETTPNSSLEIIHNNGIYKLDSPKPE